MRGQKFAHTVKQGFSIEAELENQIIPQRVGVGFDLRQKGQQGFGFRRKIKRAVLNRVIKRFDAETVARTKNVLLPLIPQRKGKHAAQMIDAIGPPLFIGRENDFRVGGRAEFITGEFGTQFKIVVKLSLLIISRMKPYMQLLP